MAKRMRVAVSACLLGEACRFDGKSVPCPEAAALAGKCELVPICPEQLGGLPTPREPAEIMPDGRVVNRAGEDVTEAFEKGAQAALEIAIAAGCTRALLKSRSPSCGVREVYDGTFSGTLAPGAGLAAAALAQAGIKVIDEELLAFGPADDEEREFNGICNPGSMDMTGFVFGSAKPG